MIQAQAGHTFDAILEGAPTGLVGTIGVRVVDPTTQATLAARTTAGIHEYPAGSGVYGVTLTAPALGANQSPWSVSVLWDTVTGGSPLTPAQTFTEELLVYASVPPQPVVGTDSPYFTVAELRARFTELTEDKYPDAKVEEWRATAEQAYEDAIGYSLVPRAASATVYATGGSLITLPLGAIRGITSVTDADGDAVDTGGSYRDGRFFTLTEGWPAGPLTVAYTHGEDAPSLPDKQAVMLLTRVWLIKGPVDDRATQIPVEGGGVINLATPGRFGQRFGIPFVDSQVEARKRVRYVV